MNAFAVHTYIKHGTLRLLCVLPAPWSGARRAPTRSRSVTPMAQDGKSCSAASAQECIHLSLGFVGEVAELLSAPPLPSSVLCREQAGGMARPGLPLPASPPKVHGVAELRPAP